MAYRWLYVVSLALALAAACGEDSNSRFFTGTGGSGGEAGGTSGTGGAGGFVDPAPDCDTSPLCRVCPSDALCDGDADCGDGYLCINSGCSDLDGFAIRQCAFAGGGACNDDTNCSPDRRCVDVDGEGKRCIQTSSGCENTTDCIVGFECEQGACVDRRVPCVLDEDCPMNHVCADQRNGNFCLRIQVDCESDIDCVDRAPFCVDIDGDGSTECAGSIGLNPASGACTNDLCTDPSAPICEASGVSSVSPCGTHGLCVGPDDCAPGFVCAELWPDGRKECVPEGGSCSSFEQCDPNQICASPRDGGPPACQVGNVDGGE